MRASSWIVGLLALGLAPLPAVASASERVKATATAPSGAGTSRPATSAPAPPGGAAGQGSGKAHTTATHEPAAVRVPSPARGGEVVVTETGPSKPSAASGGSIAEVRDAIQRAMAMTTGGAAHLDASAATPGPTGGKAVRPPTGRAPIAKGTGRTPGTSAAKPARGLALHWPDMPIGARTLDWEPDLDPRFSGLGVRLVWEPDVP